MAKRGKGRVIDRGTKKYPAFFIYISKKVVDDSAFPFKAGDDVVVEIVGDKLVISKMSRGK